MPEKHPIPVNIVGGSSFGIFPKISLEKTYNMFVSDDWLVSMAGFKKVSDVQGTASGRGFFHSVRGNFAIIVVGSSVYRLNARLQPSLVGNIETLKGEVFIDENLNGQICIVDGEDAYIYHYPGKSFTKQNLSFAPSYVTYHNTFFLLSSSRTDTNPQAWYAYDRNTDTTIQRATTLALETKPDFTRAVVRLPGRANHVLVFGETVAEVYTNVGGAENYRRNSSFNIDNGVVSNSTIASNDKMVVWLSQNSQNSPVIMVTDGGSVQSLSTDGIDFLLENIHRPDKSTAFLVRQNGHNLYYLTFFHKDDNFTLVYDFTSEMFYFATDENMDYFPARQVINFKDELYFASLNDSSVYHFDMQYDTYDYNVETGTDGQLIPRIRVCKPVRMNDAGRFRCNRFLFTIEQGVNTYSGISAANSDFCSGLLVTENSGEVIVTEDGDPMLAEDGYCLPNANRPRVDLTISKNGQQSFSNVVSKYVNTEGHYRNQMQWHRLGEANELTVQLRFWGMQRFVCYNGICEVY